MMFLKNPKETLMLYYLTAMLCFLVALAINCSSGDDDDDKNDDDMDTHSGEPDDDDDNDDESPDDETIADDDETIDDDNDASPDDDDTVDDDDSSTCDQDNLADCLETAEEVFQDSLTDCSSGDVCADKKCEIRCNEGNADYLIACYEYYQCESDPRYPSVVCLYGCWNNYKQCLNADCSNLSQCEENFYSCSGPCL